MARNSTTIPKKNGAATVSRIEPKIEESPVQAVPQSQAQVVLELQEVHSKFHSNDEALTKATAELKALKGEKERLDVRREKLLNMLAGIEPTEVQGDLGLGEGSTGDDE